MGYQDANRTFCILQKVSAIYDKALKRKAYSGIVSKGKRKSGRTERFEKYGFLRPHHMKSYVRTRDATRVSEMASGAYNLY
jgi:hypothetical protein